MPTYEGGLLSYAGTEIEARKEMTLKDQAILTNLMGHAVKRRACVSKNIYRWSCRVVIGVCSSLVFGHRRNFYLS